MSLDKEKADNGEDDSEELPPELMNMIKETVEEGTKEAKNEVTAEELATFFTRAVSMIRDDALPDKLSAAVKDKTDRQEKLNSIKDVLNPIYEALWKDLGVAYELGKHAIQQHQSILQDPKVPETIKKKLSVGIRLFSQTEQRLVRRALMGEEAYNKQLEEEQKVAKVRDELKEELDGLGVKERGKYIVSLKEEGAALREKLKGLGQEKAVEYLTNPSPEDQQLLYKLSALTMLMTSEASSHQGGCCSHGHHSHGDHGHSH